jgi:4-amino-4-deoxy-L-arabinose transferase-like glycosyltransferase
MSPASPSRSQRARETPLAPALARLGAADLALLVAAAALALLLMARAGSRRGVELMPWPDGLEYAAAAVNIDHGYGPVLRFGGYSYPSRYTEGYPLILAAARPIVGGEVARFYCVTIAIGLLAIVALYVLAFRVFGRAPALIASLLLAVSPVFITYSTLVLSDVPTLAVTLLAALALARSVEMEAAETNRGQMVAQWAAFGLLAGFTVMIRPSNTAVLAGVAFCLAMVPPAGAGLSRRRIALALAGFAALFALPVLWQMRTNLRELGGAFKSGYAFWVEEVYGSLGRTFSLAYLFGPTMPRNPHGNVIVYLLALSGLDGLLGDTGDPRFFLYPFAAAAFAAIGVIAALREPGLRAAKRVVWFGLGFLAALVAIYCLYLFTEIAFILPAAFVLFLAAGFGVTTANRWAADVLGAGRRRGARELAQALGVIALDVILAWSVAVEAGFRLSVTPQASQMVPALADAGARIGPRATVISNISLQFLELYIPGDGREFVGLNSVDPGERFTDYHLHRLYVKRDRGWRGPLPAVVFDGAALNDTTAAALAAVLKAREPVFLLLAAPETPDYADLLKDEVGRLDARFALEPVVQTRVLALYRLALR